MVMSSILASEKRVLSCNLAGSRCIFILGHREFPDQEINTTSLFMAGQGQGGGWWQLCLRAPAGISSV